MKNYPQKILLILLTTFLFVNCDSDDDSSPEIPEDNLAAFLADSTPRFSGLLDGVELPFIAGPDYQYGSSFGSDPNDESIRVLQFEINENGSDDYFRITTPSYDTASQNEFNAVFGLGTKDIGYYFDDFNFNFKIDEDVYQICGPQIGNEIEVLQVQEIIDSGQDTILRVWIQLDNLRLTDYCPTNNDYILENGLLVADFFGFRTQ